MKIISYLCITKLKKGVIDMAKVIFNVGVSHPLYNKVVEAEIITRSGGYNGQMIEAVTTEEIDFPSDPQGIIHFDANYNIIGYSERAAYSERWRGWVSKVVKDDLPQFFTTEIYAFHSGKLIETRCGEEVPFHKGEEYTINDFDYKVLFASAIVGGKQIVVVVEKINQ